MFLPALLIACEQFVQSAGKSQLWCWLWDSHASAEVGDSIWRWHRPSPCSKQGQQSSLPTAMSSWLGNTSKGWKPTGSPDNVLLCSSIMRGKVLFSYVLPKFESVLSQGTTQKNLYSLLQVFIQMDHHLPRPSPGRSSQVPGLSLYQTFNHLHALYWSHCTMSTSAW